MKDDQAILVALAANAINKLPFSFMVALPPTPEMLGGLAFGALVMLRASQLAPEWGMGLIRVLAPPEGALDDLDKAARALIESLPVSVTDDVP